MSTTPTTEPTKITAGDTLRWTRSLPDYPASEWVLSYSLINTTSKIEIVGTDDGDTHLVEVSATDSGAYVPGKYDWQAYVTKAGERITVGRGRMEVIADFAGASSYDGRSQTKVALDAVEAVIANRATLDQQSYTIQGRSLNRMTVTDLILLRDKLRVDYAREVREERLAQGLGTGNKVKVRFR